MKKIIVAAFVALTFVIYSIHQRTEGSAAVAQVTKNNNSDNTNSSTTSNTNTSSSTSPNTGTQSSSASQYKDGTYTGSEADAFYGYIQVQVKVSSGQISDVSFLQYPNDRRDSIAINSQAMPILKQQAIRAQSSQVDGVSGATDTSQAFIQSLSNALSQAKA